MRGDDCLLCTSQEEWMETVLLLLNPGGGRGAIPPLGRWDTPSVSPVIRHTR